MPVYNERATRKMLKPRTLKFLALLAGGYILLLLPGAIWPGYFDSPAGYLLFVPYLSVHLFHKLGIPGLLEHNGLCGWGWCSLTIFGMIFMVVFWVMAAWALAWGVAVLSSRFRRKPG